MIKIMKKYIAVACAATLCLNVLHAQNDLPSRSLTVESSYNPSMSVQTKLTTVPDRPETERKPVQVSYRTEANPDNTYTRTPMEVFSPKSDDVRPDRLFGTVRFGYGLRNQHDGLLDLGWRISQRDLLEVSAIMDAWASKPSGDWKSRMFNADVNMSYSHRFDSFNLAIDGSYGHSHYNFREGNDTTAAIIQASKFMLNTTRADAGIAADGIIDEVVWHFMADMQWLKRDGLKLNGIERSNSERLIHVNAGAVMPVQAGMAGIDYRQKTALLDWEGMYGAKYSNFTTITLSPYWKQSWDKLDVRAGANLDFRSSAGHSILVSPMATATYRVKGGFKLHAGLTGGLDEYDMRTLAGISPYWSENQRIKDGYTPIDISLGTSYSQGTWLSLSADAGYRHKIDDIFQLVSDSIVISSELRQGSSDAFYARLNTDLKFTERVQIRMDVQYTKWLGKYSEDWLALKPVIDGSLFGRVNVVPGVDAMLTYRMMAFGKTQSGKMPMVNDLALTVDWDFRPNLSFYLTANRLIGGNWYYYAGYRSIKPAFLLGLTYRF